jgi:hypothetical protein
MLGRPHSAWCALAVSLAVACGPTDEENLPLDVSAAVSVDVSTVVSVSWRTETPSTGYVEYGPTKDLEFNTPLSPEETVEHSQLLLGLKSDMPYFYRVVTWDGADAGRSETKSIRTGYLPPGVPLMSVEGTGHDEFTAVGTVGSFQSTLILDPDGDIVWYSLDESELDHYRVRLSRDGTGVFYSNADVSGEPSSASELVFVSFDGSERRAIPIPFLAHDFVEHADGSIAALVLEDRETNGTVVRGNTIVEIDLEGNQTEVWSSWDCFDFETHPGDNSAVGWTFTNALDYEPNEDVYYVGIHNFSSITRVNRTSRECEWVLGSTAATIDFAQGSPSFHHQHQFHVLPDPEGRENVFRIVVMDNEGPLAMDTSRVVEYEVDLETNIATETWSFISTPSVYTFVLGEPVRYPNGDTFITWSTAGQLERVTANSETTWKLNASVGTVFGFPSLAKSLYPSTAARP